MVSPPEPRGSARSAIVVDTSAAVAVLLQEERAPAIREVLAEATSRAMAAPTVVELGMVLTGRLGDDGERKLDRFLDDAEVDVVAFDERMARLAIDGFRRFGKGRHPAALNFGDCFAYALAAARGEPVLCTGNDFTRTDITVVDLGPRG